MKACYALRSLTSNLSCIDGGSQLSDTSSGSTLDTQQSDLHPQEAAYEVRRITGALYEGIRESDTPAMFNFKVTYFPDEHDRRWVNRSASFGVPLSYIALRGYLRSGSFHPVHPHIHPVHSCCAVQSAWLTRTKSHQSASCLLSRTIACSSGSYSPTICRLTVLSSHNKTGTPIRYGG
jgi:hypothetical protein